MPDDALEAAKWALHRVTALGNHDEQQLARAALREVKKHETAAHFVRKGGDDNVVAAEKALAFALVFKCDDPLSANRSWVAGKTERKAVAKAIETLARLP